MKYQLRLLLSMVRANPGYAAMAVAVDASFGVIAAVTAYVLLNSANVNPNTQSVLIFSAVLAFAGMFGVGYTLLKSRLGRGLTTGFYIYDDMVDADDTDEDEIDENY